MIIHLRARPAGECFYSYLPVGISALQSYTNQTSWGWKSQTKTANLQRRACPSPHSPKWRINLLIWKGLVTYTRFTPVATLHIPPRCHVYMFQVSSKAPRSKNALSPRILVPRCGEAATSRMASDPLGWRYGGVQRSRPLMSQGAKQQKTGGKKLEPKSCKLMFKDVEIATFSWNFCLKSTWTTWWLGKTWSISEGFGLISRFCMLHLSSKILRSRAAPAEAYRELGIAEAP